MNDEKVLDGEVFDKDGKKVKENEFVSFFKNAKKTVKDKINDGKTYINYSKNNSKFIIYSLPEGSGITAYGEQKDDEIILFGTFKLLNGAIITNNDGCVYRVVSTKKTTNQFVQDDEYITFDATLIKISKDVHEVKVIKADNKYYLFEE